MQVLEIDENEENGFCKMQLDMNDEEMTNLIKIGLKLLIEENDLKLRIEDIKKDCNFESTKKYELSSEEELFLINYAVNHSLKSYIDEKEKSSDKN